MNTFFFVRLTSEVVLQKRKFRKSKRESWKSLENDLTDLAKRNGTREQGRGNEDGTPGRKASKIYKLIDCTEWILWTYTVRWVSIWRIPIDYASIMRVILEDICIACVRKTCSVYFFVFCQLLIFDYFNDSLAYILTIPTMWCDVLMSSWNKQPFIQGLKSKTATFV